MTIVNWFGAIVLDITTYLRSARSFACSYSCAKKECIEHLMQFWEQLSK